MAEEEAAEGEEAAAKPQAQYVSMTPAFVGNYGSGPRIKFFKAEVSLRVSSDDAAAKVTANEPLLRNQLVMLFNAQPDEALATVEGKEALRKEALAEVQKALKEEAGSELVEDLLFTNLIAQ
ncbi:flagellar basal body-associated FliL family protein [Atopomonas sediminilitoris]|uniref:flagellar basal body-associated FliL family protein n=1 Tax=Atopomonas sediminilitoris TaxID=2919919 RepID=UPI001F4F0275|nr:flagellar basal body-associated FliL family protein [Atopomonas sediminilitoris]MCJ8168130.1 flagellar basal body-associated protein FliL [Atopomonas sediminilitoris]